MALISGLSRAARAGLLLKSGGVLGKMANIKTLIIDKTGTLTHGLARVQRIEATPPFTEDEVLRLAASLDQASTHVLAAALADAAAARGLALSPPTETSEDAGAGIAGRVDMHAVAVGGYAYVASRAALPRRPVSAVPDRHGISVSVAVDGVLAGEIYMDDPLRSGAAATIGQLRQLGIGKIILASGDRQAVADRIKFERWTRCHPWRPDACRQGRSGRGPARRWSAHDDR